LLALRITLRATVQATLRLGLRPIAHSLSLINPR
jgi:hypothetical protein